MIGYDYTPRWYARPQGPTPERTTRTKQHSFTDQQIDTAKHLSARRMSRDWISRFNVEDIRAFLDALHEPVSDEWQECRFEDIKKGDRVKVVDTHEAGDKTVYEGDVVQVSKGLVMTAHHQLHSVYNSKWYRIPAPVQHPDPAEHPVIIVHKTGTVIWDERPAYWNPEEREYVFQDAFCTAFLPDEITDWTPAKVVEDDR